MVQIDEYSFMHRISAKIVLCAFLISSKREMSHNEKLPAFKSAIDYFPEELCHVYLKTIHYFKHTFSRFNS